MSRTPALFQWEKEQFRSVVAGRWLIERGAGGLPSGAVLAERLAGIAFPCCVKPVRLGSSIGVGKADSIDDVRALLPMIFRLDTRALVEPFVPNLVEYNVAVGRFGGGGRRQPGGV